MRSFADVFMFQMHDAIKDLPGATRARQLLVSTALEYLNALAGEARDDRTLQQDLAVAYQKVADIQGKAYNANTGKPTAALDSYAKAIALLEPVIAAEPANETARASLAQSYLQQSRLLLLQGESKRAATVSGHAVTIFESLAAAKPSVSTRTTLADAFRVHGMNLALSGGGDAALASVKKAIEILEDLQRQRPADLDLQFELGRAYDTAGGITDDTTGPEPIDLSTGFHLKALRLDEHLVAVTGGRNAAYVRSLLADRINVCYQLYEKKDYRGAVEICRAAQPLLAQLRTDENNAQTESDGSTLRWNLGRALLADGQLAEAAEVFEENISALENMARQSNNMQVQYILAGSEHGLGTIESQLASNARSGGATRLRHWTLAKQWYEKALQRFQDVASHLTLDDSDRRPMDEAIAGLARSREEIAKLQGTATRG